MNSAAETRHVTMLIYYTEYPKGQFQAESDKIALARSTAKVIYRESESSGGRPFILLREHI